MAIPNIIPQVIVLLFYITAILFDVPIVMILGNTLSAAFVLVIVFAFSFKGHIGGGGAKLIAALSIWLGGTNVLAPFVVLTAFVLFAAIPVVGIIRDIRKKDTPSGVPVLPIAFAMFLVFFPYSDLFRQAAPRLEGMIAGSLPPDTASQPLSPAIGVAPLRSTIEPGPNDADSAKPRLTAGPTAKGDGQ